LLYGTTQAVFFISVILVLLFSWRVGKIGSAGSILNAFQQLMLLPEEVKSNQVMPTPNRTRYKKTGDHR